MRVRKDHRVDLFWVYAELTVLFCGFVPVPLKESAIKEYFFPIYFQKMSGAGYLAAPQNLIFIVIRYFFVLYQIMALEPMPRLKTVFLFCPFFHIYVERALCCFNGDYFPIRTIVNGYLLHQHHLHSRVNKKFFRSSHALLDF